MSGSVSGSVNAQLRPVVTAKKRSLGQDNAYTSMCHSVHRERAVALCHREPPGQRPSWTGHPHPGWARQWVACILVLNISYSSYLVHNRVHKIALKLFKSLPVIFVRDPLRWDQTLRESHTQVW